MSDVNNTPPSSDALQRTLNEMLASESVLDGRNGQQLQSTVESVVTDLLSDGQLRSKLLGETKVGFGMALGKFLAWKIWTEVEKSDKKRAAAKCRVSKLTLKLPPELLIDVKEKWPQVCSEFKSRAGFALPEAVLEPSEGDWVLELRGGLLSQRHLSQEWFVALTDFLVEQAPQLLSLTIVKQLVEEVRADEPVIGEELDRLRLPLTAVYRICESLLDEGIPLREMGTILSSIILAWEQGSDRQQLLSCVRKGLSPWICREVQVRPGVIRGMKIGRRIEEVFAEAVRYVGSEQSFALDPQKRALVSALLKQALAQMGNPQDLVVLVNHRIRRELKSILRADFPRLVVLSESEIHRGFKLEIVAVIDFKERTTEKKAVEQKAVEQKAVQRATEAQKPAELVAVPET